MAEPPSPVLLGGLNKVSEIRAIGAGFQSLIHTVRRIFEVAVSHSGSALRLWKHSEGVENGAALDDLSERPQLHIVEHILLPRILLHVFEHAQ